MKKVIFPQDELPHQAIIEWWYWNGHLWDEQGRQYAFMDCLFKADAKKVKIPVMSLAPLKTFYFAHSLLTDIKAYKFTEIVDPVVFLSNDSFKNGRFKAYYINPWHIRDYSLSVMEKLSAGCYRLKRDNFDLHLTAQKPMLLEGGSGFLKFANKSTYYYSLPRLNVSGTLLKNNKEIPVHGLAWMDHQWSDTPYSHDHWTWFSLQLQNGWDLVCYEYFDGKVNNYLASVSLPNGKSKHSAKLELKPVKRKWISPKTKAVYNLDWEISVPDFDFKANVSALNAKQEMNYGPINYWEGPISVQAEIAGKKVGGVGFMEIVGRPTFYNDFSVFKKNLLKKISLI